MEKEPEKIMFPNPVWLAKRYGLECSGEQLQYGEKLLLTCTTIGSQENQERFARAWKRVVRKFNKGLCR